MHALTTITVVMLVVTTTACPRWTDPVRSDLGAAIVEISADDVPCFRVQLYANASDRSTLADALVDVCRALRDPTLRNYLGGQRAVLKTVDRSVLESGTVEQFVTPETLANVAFDPPRPASFHVVAAKVSSPGVSTICKDGDVAARALAVDRSARLRPNEDTRFDRALLVGTLAHELMHLHPRSEATCTNLFVDDGNDVSQCRSWSYAVGNAAACSCLARMGDPRGSDFAACMAAQADITPGGQGSGARDGLGCRLGS